MTTVLIIVCIVASIVIAVYAVAHFGTAIRLDKSFRERIAHRYSRRRSRSSRAEHVRS